MSATTRLIDSPHEAADLLRRGALVAFPTETVFGLGVDATNEAAVRRLFAAKGRPSDNPLIVHVADAGRWSDAAAALTDSAEKLLAAFAPGPLTVVLPKRPAVSQLVTAGLDTVGVRAPSDPVAAEILSLAGVPVAAPSANRSGRPSCTRWRSVLEDLNGRIDAVFCRDVAGVGLESTVVDCTSDPPVLLRPGAVTIDQIRAVAPGAREIGFASSTGTPSTGPTRSPGLAHPHYQPDAAVRLVDLPREVVVVAGELHAYCGLTPATQPERLVLHAAYADVEHYAAEFFEFLREADRRGATTIWVQRAPDERVGRALRDRQDRAAAKG